MSEHTGQTAIKPFSVGDATFGDGRLTIIAGPCVVESREHVLMMARECWRRAKDAGLDYVFKASFDKANRSSHESFRGIGVADALDALRAVKGETGLPVLTDVHDVAQVDLRRVATFCKYPPSLARPTSSSPP